MSVYFEGHKKEKHGLFSEDCQNGATFAPFMQTKGKYLPCPLPHLPVSPNLLVFGDLPPISLRGDVSGIFPYLLSSSLLANPSMSYSLSPQERHATKTKAEAHLPISALERVWLFSSAFLGSAPSLAPNSCRASQTPCHPCTVSGVSSSLGFTYTVLAARHPSPSSLPWGDFTNPETPSWTLAPL